MLSRSLLALTCALLLTGCSGGTVVEGGTGEQTNAVTTEGWNRIDPVEVDLEIGEPINGEIPSEAGPLVVNVWATFCHPCRKELPLLQQAAESGKVAVLGLSRDQKVGTARAFLAEYGADFPNRLDRDADFAVALDGRIPINMIPSSALVVDGKVVAVHIGEFKSVAEIVDGPTG